MTNFTGSISCLRRMALVLIASAFVAAKASAAPVSAINNFTGTGITVSSIRWSWNDANNETGYRVMKGTVNLSGDLPANTTFWVQVGLSTNTLEGPLFVQGFNATDTRDSMPDSAYTLAATPANLGATAVTSTTINLTWSSQGNPAGTLYELQRSTGTGFGFVANTATTSFLNAGLSPSTTYTYRARAFNGDSIATAFSATFTTMTASPPPPAAPSGFSGTAQSPTSILWIWTDNSNDETGFRVMKGTINLSGNLAANTTSWLETGLSTNTLEGPLFVQAFGIGGNSDSNADSAFTLAATPANLAVTAVSSTTVDLAWSAEGNPTGTSYELQRSTGSGFGFLALTATTTYHDFGLIPGTTYTYQVRAYNGDLIATSFSNSASTVTGNPDAPAAPTDFAGTAQSESSILWTWTDNADNETGYRVMKGTVNLSGDLAADTTFWLETGLSTNTLEGPLFAQAFNAGGTSDSNVDSAFTLAATPADLAVTAVSSTTVDLAWSAEGNPAGTSYELQRSTGSGFGFLALTATTSYHDFGLTPGTTYTYQVRALNGDLIATGFSNSVSTVTGNPDAPAAPTDFTGTAQSESNILWTWTDNADNETGYRVMKGTVNLSGDLTADTTFWLETGLSTNTLEGPLFAQAFNAGGTSDSNVDSAFTLAATPADLAVTAVSSTTVDLAWSAEGNPAGTSYELQRSTGSGFGFLALTATTSYHDFGLTPGTTYSYQVRAFNGDLIATGFSNAVSTVTGSSDAPDAPTGFSGSAQSESSILWTWTDNADNETGYRVMKGTVNLSGDLSADTTFWLETGLSTNTLEGPLFVRAFNAGGTSDSNVDSAFTLAATPADLAVTAVSSTTVDLAWSAEGNPNGTSYELQRSTGSGFGFLALTATTSYHDFGLTPGTTYSYQVRAFNGDLIATGFSNTVSTVTGGSDATLAPTAPSSFSGTGQSASSILWTWADNAGNEDGYRVMKGTVNLSGDLPAGTTSWLETGLSTNTLEGPLFAQAFNGGGTSDSNVDSAFTLAAAPADLAVTAVSSTTVDLAWSAQGNPAGTNYELQRSTGSGFGFLTLTATTSYHDFGLAPGTTYAYQVRAYNGEGITTAFSNIVTTTTLGTDSAPSSTTVRAEIRCPHNGATVHGNRVTVLAELTIGTPAQTGWVLFQYRPSGPGAWIDMPAANAQHPNPDTKSPYFIHWNVTALPSCNYDLRAVAYDRNGNPDPAPPMITVCVNSSNPSIVEHSAGGGKITRVQRLSNASQNLVYATNEVNSQVLRILLPIGVLNLAQAQLTTLSNPGGLSPHASLRPVGPVVEFSFAEAGAGLVPGQTVLATVFYTDEDGDGVIDQTQTKASSLRLSSFNPLAGWLASPDSSVDPTLGTVTGSIFGFQPLAIIAPAQVDLSAVRVYPTPFRPSAGNPDLGSDFSTGDVNSGIVFDNLPTAATIKIYAGTGRLVRQLPTLPSGRTRWDAKNDDGADVASGAYTAVISAAGERPVTRKVVILR